MVVKIRQTDAEKLVQKETGVDKVKAKALVDALHKAQDAGGIKIVRDISGT